MLYCVSRLKSTALKQVQGKLRNDSTFIIANINELKAILVTFFKVENTAADAQSKLLKLKQNHTLLADFLPEFVSLGEDSKLGDVAFIIYLRLAFYYDL